MRKSRAGLLLIALLCAPAAAPRADADDARGTARAEWRAAAPRADADDARGTARAEWRAAAPRAAAPQIAVVIDDFGLTYKKNVPDEDWYKIRWPITCAVMPESPRTRQAAKRVKETGHELIIHFPFDPFLSGLKLPKDRLDPGDWAKVEALLNRALRDIPDPVGMNNHRSYKATQNRPLMAEFMKRIKPRNLYFLDSHVTPKSVAFSEARAAGIPAAKGWIFLEEPRHYSKEFAAKFLRRAAARARKTGSAIVIGHHYYRGTYEALVEEVPKLQAEGFEFVFASALLER